MSTNGMPTNHCQFKKAPNWIACGCHMFENSSPTRNKNLHPQPCAQPHFSPGQQIEVSFKKTVLLLNPIVQSLKLDQFQCPTKMMVLPLANAPTTMHWPNLQCCKGWSTQNSRQRSSNLNLCRRHWWLAGIAAIWGNI